MADFLYAFYIIETKKEADQEPKKIISKPSVYIQIDRTPEIQVLYSFCCVMHLIILLSIINTISRDLSNDALKDKLKL